MIVDLGLLEVEMRSVACAGDEVEGAFVQVTTR